MDDEIIKNRLNQIDRIFKVHITEDDVKNENFSFRITYGKLMSSQEHEKFKVHISKYQKKRIKALLIEKNILESLLNNSNQSNNIHFDEKDFPAFPQDRIESHYNPYGNFKFLGYLLIMLGFFGGLLSDHCECFRQLLVFIAFVLLLIGLYILIKCQK